ncbi:hypothetical protein [Halorubrum sp. CBA1229]|uniref:hypothetical protein n=1 Tax=Halorubrum sp. CBA1229 TaxID=1853699 RepID=UPI000F41C759|nr:hypothetical protein [Halorubrum sp. CBA1229]QKY18294.1 hypothetical protein Hrr1229_015910 [Halorubrum sp. CBA1229]
MWGFLGNHLSTSLVVGIGAIVVLLRFRRWKAVGAAAAGIFSSAASIAVAVVVAMFGLVALGYWEPPIGQIVSDALGAGRAAYDLVGEWVLEQTVERLEDIAAA